MKKLFVFFIIFSNSIIFSQEKFKIEEVEVNNLLKGNLYTPNGLKTGNLVIIIAGSGIPDRNGNMPQMQNNSLKFLAQSLAENGNSVYSFDKRTLVLLKDPKFKEETLTLDVFIKDVKDIITFFKAKNEYSKIILAGHSEGSLIAMQAMSSDVAALISIAGAGRTIDEVITEQITKQSPLLEQEVKNNFKLLKEGKTFELKNPQLISIFRPSLQPYLISWIRLNPQEIIAKISQPVLVINGTKDIQVSEDEAELLKTANPKVQLALIANMNHVLKTITGDASENMASYSNPELPINQELITTITDFLANL